MQKRLAGADANPYLAMAATLAAGLAGMQERLQPTAPVEGNGYHQARGLPHTFSTAHEQMAHSVHAPRLLGARFVQAYLAVKGLEHQSYLAEVSAWERRFLLPQV
jgi:glutamine synthetase